MADDPTQGTTPDPNETPADPETTPDPEPAAEPKVFEEAYVKELRAAAAANRKEAKALKAQVEAYEAEKLTELEKIAKERDAATARADESENRARELALGQLVFTKATEFQNPIDALKFGRELLELDDAGNPTNMDEMLAAVLEERPYLKKGDHSPPAISASNPNSKKGDGKQLTREQLKHMAPEAVAQAHDKGQLDHLLKVS
jgi:hypothetical protein